jgi:hypothetical protein
MRPHSTKAAITELRQLARGIHASVLDDRGLDAALSALAARSHARELDVRLPDRGGRCSRTAEAAVYFAAESLRRQALARQRVRVTVRLRAPATARRQHALGARRGQRRRRAGAPGGGLDGIAHRIAAAGGMSPPRQSPRRPDRPGGERPVRILICEDSACCARARAAARGRRTRGRRRPPRRRRLDETVEATAPELCILDVRLPPTFTDEGIRAALLRAQAPRPGRARAQPVRRGAVRGELITDAVGPARLPAEGRVADVSEFLDAVERIGAGSTVLDPEVVAQLLTRRGRDDRMNASPIASAPCWR